MFDFNGMPDGMDIKGSWYNKRTGKTITVRDMYMDDSGMQVMTNTGEMIDGDEFSRDYIQCDGTVYDEKGNSTGQQEAIDYDAMFGGMSSEQPKSPTYSDIMGIPVTPKTAEPENKKFEMLKTMFDKLRDIPTVTASIKWKNIPKSELNMLKMYFDITTEDIADYIYKTYCSEVELKFAIEESIKSLLNKTDK
jgi:hypothetical protein